jgi:hypothetical protein
MRNVFAGSSLLAAVLAVTAVADLAAQGGGGRGRGRAEEITNRVGVFFTDVKGPMPAGEKAGELPRRSSRRRRTASGRRRTRANRPAARTAPAQPTRWASRIRRTE